MVLGGKGPLGTGSDQQEAKDAGEIVLARAEMDPEVLRGPCQPESSSWGVFPGHEFLEGLQARGQVAACFHNAELSCSSRPFPGFPGKWARAARTPQPAGWAGGGDARRKKAQAPERLT